MNIPETIGWLPAFKGADYSFLDCEILSLENVEGPIRIAEWNNTEAIWFDYVRLHPIKAFYFFAHCYKEQYSEYLERFIEIEHKFRTGLKGDPIKSKELNQLLAVKRIADKHGIPYRFFLNKAFLFFAANGWTRPPRPSHIATNDGLVQSVLEAWAEQTDATIAYSDDPWFRAEHWVGHQAQARYEDWLVANIRLKSMPHFSLCFCLYVRENLRIERAVQEFGESTVWEAQKFCVC